MFLCSSYPLNYVLCVFLVIFVVVVWFSFEEGFDLCHRFCVMWVAMNDAPGALEVFLALICVKVASVLWSGQVVREMTKIHCFGGVRCDD